MLRVLFPLQHFIIIIILIILIIIMVTIFISVSSLSLSLSLNAFFVLHLFLVFIFFNTLNTPFFRVPKPGFHKNFVFQLEYRSLLVDNIHCNTIECNIFEFGILSLFINTYWYILKNVVTINAIDL